VEEPVAKPEWGSKRICQDCGARFYDLRRNPIVCPKCGAKFDASAFSRARRARPGAAVIAATAKPVPVEAAVAPLVDGAPVVDDAVVLEAVEPGDEDLIEDVSELGEDDDDMSEVIEKVDTVEER
jgi:uncharacterized protein (TIGR02300 family)